MSRDQMTCVNTSLPPQAMIAVRNAAKQAGTNIAEYVRVLLCAHVQVPLHGKNPRSEMLYGKLYQEYLPATPTLPGGAPPRGSLGIEASRNGRTESA